MLRCTSTRHPVPIPNSKVPPNWQGALPAINYNPHPPLQMGYVLTCTFFLSITSLHVYTWALTQSHFRDVNLHVQQVTLLDPKAPNPKVWGGGGLSILILLGVVLVSTTTLSITVYLTTEVCQMIGRQVSQLHAMRKEFTRMKLFDVAE